MPGRDLLRLQLMFQVAAVRRYADLPIPSHEDVLVEEFVREWMAGASASHEAERALNGLSRGMLGTFAIRSASRAVRERNVEYLKLGIAAQCISGGQADPRDLQQVTSVLYDSCRKLAVEPVLLFREALPLASGGVAQILQEFVALDRSTFSLQTYRVRESSDESGFRYRLGGPGAA